MKTKCISSIIILTILISSTVVFAEDDWEHWGTYTLNVKITDKLKFVLSPTIRLRDDATDFYYWESSQGLAYKLNDHFELGLHHLYDDSKNSSGQWTEENRVKAEITGKENIGPFTLSDRVRYEYRVVGGKPKSSIRNNIKIDTPFKYLISNFPPYIANEFFYDFRINDYNENRAQFSASKKINNNTTFSLYYMLRSNKAGSDWAGTNVIGTVLSSSL
ncbi:MAG: DUF2490 domain-containing protein [Candidatus Omnitrophota bacterium]